MTREEELRGLWNVWQATKRQYEGLAMINTVGQTPNALFDLDLAYRQAMRTMMAAEDAYAAGVRAMMETMS